MRFCLRMIACQTVIKFHSYRYASSSGVTVAVHTEIIVGKQRYVCTT